MDKFVSDPLMKKESNHIFNTYLASILRLCSKALNDIYKFIKLFAKASIALGNGKYESFLSMVKSALTLYGNHKSLTFGLRLLLLSKMFQVSLLVRYQNDTQNHHELWNSLIPSSLAKNEELYSLDKAKEFFTKNLCVWEADLIS